MSQASSMAARPPIHDRMPVWFQRVENATIAVLTVVMFVDLDFAWWWLPALFLLFDLSMVGYLRDPRLGAWTYNIVHSYIGPAAAVIGIVTASRSALFLALVLGFHIAVDRFFGYGLKFRDHFTHTHLGDKGSTRPAEHRRRNGQPRSERGSG